MRRFGIGQIELATEISVLSHNDRRVRPSGLTTVHDKGKDSAEIDILRGALVTGRVAAH